MCCVHSYNSAIESDSRILSTDFVLKPASALPISEMINGSPCHVSNHNAYKCHPIKTYEKRVKFT